jgi:hypothetical protein
MGDEGKLYVAPELVQAYRDRIMPLASVLVPNQVSQGSGSPGPALPWNTVRPEFLNVLYCGLSCCYKAREMLEGTY